MQRIVLTTSRSWLMWTAGLLFVAYQFAVMLLPGALSEKLQYAFIINAQQLGLSASLYLYAYSLMQPIVGLLFDRSSCRWLMAGGCTITALGFILPVVFPTFSIFLVGQAMKGVGTSFAFVGTLYIVASFLSSKPIGLLTGITSATGFLAGALVVAPLTSAGEFISWQALFIIFTLIGFALAVVMAVTIQKEPSKDYIEGKCLGQDNLLKQLKTDMQNILSQRQTWIISLAASGLGIAMYAFATVWSIIYLRTINGIPYASAAKASGGFYAGWLIGGPLLGWAGDYLINRKKLLILASLANIGLTAYLIYIPSLSITVWWGLFLIMGFIASAALNCFPLILRASPMVSRGVSLATLNSLTLLIAAIFQWLIGALLDWGYAQRMVPTLNEAQSVYSIQDFRIATLVLPLMAAAGLMACFWVRNCNNSRPTDCT